MLLTARKGQEHGLVISQKIDDRNEFMYSAYRQALDALNEIIRQAKKIPKPNEKDLTIKLYGYTHNIITFSGSRGQGKTSAMISFSGAMEASSTGAQGASPLFPGDCGFTVLPPIDPTILEENQSILAVILSRMYRLAEEAWQNACSLQSYSSHYTRSEAEKNELLDLFQRCLSGINAIKFRKGEEIKSLLEIHEISDSSILKENFYELTTKLLRFVSKEKPSEYPFLVVQLDDTDFQIRKGYEILEDIRKFLTLPNVIILMATDLDMLRNALIQHYIEEFERGLRTKIIGVNDLKKIESKYLDKLIPPTFAVYLPHLDDMLRQQGHFLQLTYIDPEEEEEARRKQRAPVNLLLPPDSGFRTEDFSFQSLLLWYIYRKTRIVFAEPLTYMHNLIPTTLRGLAQFLGMLSSMQDVPEILPNDPRIDDPHILAGLVREQVDILEINLPLFENYFLNDWVHTKLPKDKSAVLEQLFNVLPEQRCKLAITSIQELYADSYRIDLDDPPNDYLQMVELIQYLKESHRQMEDYYFFFAIHTFFTIQFHKAVVHQKKLAVESFLSPDNQDKLLLFDFSPESTVLPTQYQLPDLPREVGRYPIMIDLRAKEYDAIQKEAEVNRSETAAIDYAIDLLLPLSQDSSHHFSYINFIALFLSLGSPKGKELVKGEPSQRNLYLAQTSAATLAINWDVQDQFRKLSKEDLISSEVEQDFITILRNMWRRTDNSIKSINKVNTESLDAEARKKPWPMIYSHLETMVDFIVGTDVQSNLRHMLQTLERHLRENYLQALCEIYSSAQHLKACVSQNPKDGTHILDASRSMVDTLRQIRISAIKQQLNLDPLVGDIDAVFSADPQTPSFDTEKFINALDEQLEELYNTFGYSEEDIEFALASKEVQ